MSIAPEYPYSTADLAAEFKLAPKTIRKKAFVLKIGIDLGGSAGFRYSEADKAALVASMRPTAKPEKGRTGRKRQRARARTAA